MQTEKTSAGTGVKCSLLPLHFLNRNTSKFSWLRSSIHQDTFVAKHEDGSFSILKVKEKGIVSSFVLDPNLRCVFWDNENVSEHHQWLFAQASNEDILLYSVDEDGVTETLHISHTKVSGVVNASQSVNADLQGGSLNLVGCERGHIILQYGRLWLCCVEVSASGDIDVKSTVPLPHSASAPDATFASDTSTFPCYQIVNGTVVVINCDACLLHNKSPLNATPYEQLGTFDPLPNIYNEKLVSLDIERIKYHIAQGVALSRPVEKLLGLAGLLPVHPMSYITAKRNRKLQAAAAAQSEEKNSDHNEQS